ncbi:N-acetylgalactosamine-4-sulfatase [Echinicola strongylocentroti]|uniref:N-acetylgalactosamine-4-sulfatase n=1 Tax=Echinicola strongylocentroti TaxID=1795355 RepID=A0A2Z4INU9_9BACT|nr:arylsulfatase [Echinicola strongylocentroti]AWW32791.1 N-acetylgalactosamine-4-sulfatase [Echinicola strongylocentroti]
MRLEIKLLASFLCMVLLGCGSTRLDAVPKDRPNVILILVDDQGYGDIASLGNPYIKTPNIDQLHEVSARFTDYHVNPTCAPSRAALLTGHNANRTGVWHTVNGRSLILEREITAAQIMKENGYATGIFGKWHLGDNYPFRPEDKGFEEVLVHGGGGIEQTMDYFDNDYYNDTYIHNGKLEQYEGYCTDIWFEEAMKFMDSNQDQPFFCYLPTNAAHSPYFVDDSYIEPYKDNEDIPLPAFYGMIANIDENIGKLMDHLEKNGQLDNTIVIFTTDNGTAQGARVEGHRLDGFVNQGYNAGMRGIKASKYEGGHRVPLFIHWKNGGITVGKDIDELAAHYDILPTLVEMCDLEVRPEIDFDGKSLLPLINGDKGDFKDRIVITNSQRTEVPEPWRRTSLMQGKWRLIDGTELYNLEKDPEQRENIADQHPEKMKEFKAAYDRWWKDLEPGYEDQPRIYVGHEEENPTKLYCHDWHTEEVSPWHQRHIREGFIDNGYWLIKVAEGGKYRVRLRRWPVETGLSLGAEAPVRPALPGTSVNASKLGKAMKIKEARLAVQGIEMQKEASLADEYVEFEVDLKKGDTRLQTWFTLEDQKELGAYFVEVKKL